MCDTMYQYLGNIGVYVVHMNKKNLTTAGVANASTGLDSVLLEGEERGGILARQRLGTTRRQLNEKNAARVYQGGRKKTRTYRHTKSIGHRDRVAEDRARAFWITKNLQTIRYIKQRNRHIYIDQSIGHNLAKKKSQRQATRVSRQEKIHQLSGCKLGLIHSYDHVQ